MASINPQSISFSDFRIEEDNIGNQFSLQTPIADEKIQSISNSFFQVRHTIGYREFTINKKSLIDMGSKIWNHQAGSGPIFSKIFKTDKEKILASHLLLDCLHSNLTELNRNALITMVKEKTSFFGSKTCSFFSSLAPTGTLEKEKKVILGASALQNILKSLGCENPKKLAHDILNGSMQNPWKGKPYENRWETEFHDFLSPLSIFSNEKKDKQYVEVKQEDLIRLCSALLLYVGNEASINKTISSLEKKWIQTAEVKGRLTFLKAIRKEFKENMVPLGENLLRSISMSELEERDPSAAKQTIIENIQSKFKDKIHQSILDRLTTALEKQSLPRLKFFYLGMDENMTQEKIELFLNLPEKTPIDPTILPIPNPPESLHKTTLPQLPSKTLPPKLHSKTKPIDDPKREPLFPRIIGNLNEPSKEQFERDLAIVAAGNAFRLDNIAGKKPNVETFTFLFYLIIQTKTEIPKQNILSLFSKIDYKTQLSFFEYVGMHFTELPQDQSTKFNQEGEPILLQLAKKLKENRIRATDLAPFIDQNPLMTKLQNILKQ